jgi:Fe-S cluster biogenesis protein NfuA
MFPESPAIKSIENKLKLITNKYPLIKLDGGEVKIKDFQKYIDGINLLEEKGALDD